mmetsp:Transcript_51952/g.111117  ORF Transcript_51952/g.111117 Transcript_51952/m.111117 type:complete len:453 (+) Transcript_51952:59-1417(+)
MLPSPSSPADPQKIRRHSSWIERNAVPLTAGGIRQSAITLFQTALGGGVLTLAYALRLTGLGLGLVLLVFTGMVAFLGMDVLMRGAKKMDTYDTAGVLAKCLGRWSGPAMDLLLTAYGHGSTIAYLILLGDFLPAVLVSVAPQSYASSLASLPPGVLRERCILAALVPVVPLCIPRTLAALRYATPVSIIAITITACTVVSEAPALAKKAQEHDAIVWVHLDWSCFQAFSIFLFGFNCHLNVVPVASELVDNDGRRIQKINRYVVLGELSMYAIVAAGGYLSFLGETSPNILRNYGLGNAATVCRLLLSCSLFVATPTLINPTIRSFQALVGACAPWPIPASPKQEPLLDGGGRVGGERLRLGLTALCLCICVPTSIFIPNVAVVTSYLGATTGTALMCGLPAALLLKYRPSGDPLEGYSQLGYWLASLCILLTAAVFAFVAIFVMFVQQVS